MLDSEPQIASEPIQILHVDDDLSILEISKAILGEMDTSLVVDFVYGVDEAFRKLAEKKYDVIISDYEMPQKSGLDFLKALREQAISIPFILFTGKGREEIAIKALNMGADGYYNKQGDPETVYGELLHGIKMAAQHKKAEEKLVASESKYRSIFNNAEVGMYRTRIEGSEIIDCNEMFLRIFGRTREEVIGKPSVIHWVDPAERQKMVTLLMAKGEVTDYPCRMLNNQGETRFCRTSLKFYREKAILEGSIIDITEQKNAEIKLKESEARFRSLYENSFDAVLVGDPYSGEVLGANLAACKLFGMTENEIKQVGRAGIMVEDERANGIFKKRKEYGGKITVQLTYRRKDGSTFEGEAASSTFKDFDGTVKASIVIRDVTESKRAQLELESKYETLERVAGSIDSGLAIISRDYRVVWANSVLSNLGFEPNQKCYQTVHRNDVCPDCGAKKVFEENASFDMHEYKIAGIKGENRFVELRVTPLKDKHGNVAGAIELAVPINERKKAEEKLRESEEKFRKLSEESPNMIFINRKGRVVYANKKCTEVLGYSLQEFYSPDFNFISIIDPESRLKLKEVFAKHMKGEEIPPYEYTLISRKGDRIQVEINSKLLDYDGEKAILGVVTDISERKKLEEEAVLGQKEWQQTFDAVKEIILLISPNFEILQINKAGCESLKKIPQELIGKKCYEIVHGLDKPIPECPCAETLRTKKAGRGELTQHGRCLALAASPVFDENNKIKAFVHAVADITEHKAYEKKLIDDQSKLALMNEKLRVVGSLTRHDVGNKLMAAKSNMYLLRKKLKDKPELLKYADAVDDAFNQSNRIFKFSKMYEIIGVEKPETMSVGGAFDEAKKLIPHNGVEFVNKAQGLTVLADSLLRQLFYNLIDNSIKHGKTVTKIQLTYTQNDKETKLIFEDNGVGIPEVNKSKIFLEGFTTSGSGLGLKLVKKMIEVYGWTVAEEGAPNQGAKFVITIPTESVYSSQLEVFSSSLTVT